MSNQNGGKPHPREILLMQTLSSMPQAFHPFIINAFSIFDAEVSQKRRSYSHVGVQEMCTIAMNLYYREAQKQQMLPASSASGFPSSLPSVDQGWAPSRMTRVQHKVPEKQTLSQVDVSPFEQRRTQASIARKRPFDQTSHRSDRERFQIFAKGHSSHELQSSTFIGNGTAMERKYSRDAPTPDDIRPVHVLKKALNYITAESIRLENSSGRPVALKYLGEQLKGMRQDLRVQDIKDNFAVTVYETHAKLSLEVGDLGEFSQCQSALKQLYLLPSIERSRCSIAEFFCYRIVYLSLGNQFDSLSTELIHYTNLHLKRKEVKSVVQHIPRNVVQLALRLTVACDNGDIGTINAVLLKFPIEMRYLLQIYLQKRRVMWLNSLVTGVKGKLTMHTVLSTLGYLPTRHVSGNGEEIECWLDASIEKAEKEAIDFFHTIKIILPANFSIQSVIKNVNSLVFPIDAEKTKSLVDSYIQYLGTRRDAVSAE